MTFPFKLGLDKARREARKALGGVASGKDPLQERRKAEAPAENTFQSVCEEYLRRDGKGLRSRGQIEQTLKRLVYPKLGKRQIDDIKRSDIVRLLDKIEDEHGAGMATNTLAHVRKIMNWHATRSDDFRTPIVRGMARTKPKERARDRVLTDDELRAISGGAGKSPGPFGYFIRFVLLTATRRNEAADIRDTELIRRRLDHSGRPLQDQAGSCRPAVSGNPRSPRVDPADQAGAVLFYDRLRTHRRLYEIQEDFDKDCKVKGWTLHDLRRTARSLMSRAGVDADIAERCLGHAIPGIRGVYDRHAYHAEKKAAFEALAGQIDRILNPKDNVIPMGRSEVPA